MVVAVLVGAGFVTDASGMSEVATADAALVAVVVATALTLGTICGSAFTSEAVAVTVVAIAALIAFEITADSARVTAGRLATGADAADVVEMTEGAEGVTSR